MKTAHKLSETISSQSKTSMKSSKTESMTKSSEQPGLLLNQNWLICLEDSVGPNIDDIRLLEIITSYKQSGNDTHGIGIGKGTGTGSQTFLVADIPIAAANLTPYFNFLRYRMGM